MLALKQSAIAFAICITFIEVCILNQILRPATTMFV